MDIDISCRMLLLSVKLSWKTHRAVYVNEQAVTTFPIQMHCVTCCYELFFFLIKITKAVISLTQMFMKNAWKAQRPNPVILNMHKEVGTPLSNTRKRIDGGQNVCYAVLYECIYKIRCSFGSRQIWPNNPPSDFCFRWCRLLEMTKMV